MRKAAEVKTQSGLSVVNRAEITMRAEVMQSLLDDDSRATNPQKGSPYRPLKTFLQDSEPEGTPVDIQRKAPRPTFKDSTKEDPKKAGEKARAKATGKKAG